MTSHWKRINPKREKRTYHYFVQTKMMPIKMADPKEHPAKNHGKQKLMRFTKN